MVTTPLDLNIFDSALIGDTPGKTRVVAYRTYMRYDGYIVTDTSELVASIELDIECPVEDTWMHADSDPDEWLEEIRNSSTLVEALKKFIAELPPTD